MGSRGGQGQGHGARGAGLPRQSDIPSGPAARRPQPQRPARGSPAPPRARALGEDSGSPPRPPGPAAPTPTGPPPARRGRPRRTHRSLERQPPGRGRGPGRAAGPAHGLRPRRVRLRLRAAGASAGGGHSAGPAHAPPCARPSARRGLPLVGGAGPRPSTALPRSSWPSGPPVRGRGRAGLPGAEGAEGGAGLGGPRGPRP